MNILTTAVARILFAIPILIFGLFHIFSANQMAEIVPLPGGVFWVYLTGLALILAAVSFLIKKQTRLAGLLLGILLIIFALSVHLPTLLGGDQMAMGQVLKDLGLAAGAFGFAGSIEKEPGQA